MLLVLTEGAVKLDKTGKIRPDAVLGRHASLTGKPAAYDALAALTAEERQEIAASQTEILRAWAWAWAWAVGPPLLAGVLPFGVGPMAAADARRDVAGTIALLNQTAADTADLTCGGTPGNNKVWGEGKLDAFAAAVNQSPRTPVSAARRRGH